MTDTIEGKRKYWASHVNEWKASGESKRSYCRQHKLKPNQLGYWAQVFGKKSQTNHESETKAFVAVKVAAPDIQGLTVKLPNGLRLEGIHSGNIDVTQALIGSLI